MLKQILAHCYITTRSMNAADGRILDFEKQHHGKTCINIRVRSRELTTRNSQSKSISFILSPYLRTISVRDIKRHPLSTMHFYLMPILATIVRLAAAQDGRTLVTGLTNTIAVSNGGIGGTAVCKVAGTLDRGNQPIGFAAQRTCDKIQNDGIFKATPIKFDSNPDLSLLVSCNVKPGDYGTFLE